MFRLLVQESSDNDKMIEYKFADHLGVTFAILIAQFANLKYEEMV